MGTARGASSFVGSWAVVFAIGRLTGSAAVVLLLVVGVVGLVAGAVVGGRRLRGLRSLDVRCPSTATVGETVALHVTTIDTARSRTPLDVTIDLHGRRASAALIGGHATIEAVVVRAGTVTSLHGSVSTTGAGGLVRWRRSFDVTIEPVSVAPRAVGELLDARHDDTTTAGSTSSRRPGPRDGDVDGVRPWRAGEGDAAIHWPSTVRSRQIVAHDRQPSVETRWTVPLDSEPGRLRRTLEAGLRAGHLVRITTDDGPVDVRTTADAHRWSTIAADRRNAADGGVSDDGSGDDALVSDDDGGSRLTRARPSSRHERTVDEPLAFSPRSRWLAALAAAVALQMLIGALGGETGTRLLAVLGVVVGAAVSVRFRDGVVPLPVRAAVIVAALGALARIALQAQGVGGLIEALRGPMPDLLMVLLVLHGAESADRRTVRVHLAITATVVGYAAGLRIDDRVGWWMAAWAVLAVAALTSLTAAPPSHDDRRARGRDTDGAGPIRRSFRLVVPGAVALAAVVGLAALVPVPSGPASLGLPALSDDSAVVDRPGALAGPDGSTTDGGPSSTGGTPPRGALGQVGGYPGFSSTLDTSVRGGLGDETVMRVRAPEPAFWRGQTFSDFDGRVWTVDDSTTPVVDGPTIRIEPTVGSRPAPGVPVERFVQTYHVEADLPNVLFAASRPETVVFDGGVSARPDAALRADRTLTDGTIYTVVSQRPQVTPDMLRAQGDLADRFGALDDARVDELLAPFLALPASTTDRTRELAGRLAVPGSTYDTIRAYESWLGANTEYDLNAPVPAAGVDAVDDFLFGSRRGFCEQIASSLVVMLRSQGVPARLATGYVAGERDRVSGVWKVRASDAHAWVEVWFPETGWEAFDPTASVPLAGDASAATVGGDLASALIDGVASRPVEIGAVLILGLGAGAGLRALREMRRRRRRGPWGLLHDRFVDLADERVTTAPAAARRIVASAWSDAVTEVDPTGIARRLDRVAFDPGYAPSETERRAVAADVAALERARRATRRSERHATAGAPSRAPGPTDSPSGPEPTSTTSSS